jgi:tetratricopeptide (TPR) repeat protein
VIFSDKGKVSIIRALYDMLINKAFNFKRMKTILISLCLLNITTTDYAQRGYNYYKDSITNGSPDEKAFAYFKKAYYDCIWKWTTEGADSAEYYLKLAIQEDTNYTAAYAFLAHVYQFKTYDNIEFDKKFALQKKYAEKAMSFHPKTGDTYSVMSDVVWTEHDTTQALNLLRTAISMEPDNVGNYLFLATRFTQIGNADDSAIFYLNKLLQYDPEYGQAFMKLGNVYNWDKQNYDSAKFYYRKAIENYQTVVPRDNRMMYGYYFLATVYAKEAEYDSAIHLFNTFVQEMKPSDMYVRDQFLDSAYRALYNCYQNLARNNLNQLIKLNERRIANNTDDGGTLLNMLEQNFMNIEQDSIYEKYALPLARRIQTIHSSDPYINIYALDDEFVILRRLKRNDEALKVLQSFNLKNPNEPAILFDLGRIKISVKDNQAGFAYLRKSKSNLNDVFTKQVFMEQLSNPDFDRVRDTPEFKKLVK